MLPAAEKIYHASGNFSAAGAEMIFRPRQQMEMFEVLI